MRFPRAIRKALKSFLEAATEDEGEGFTADGYPRKLDPYLCHAWVNIAVGILIRNVARADFTVVRDGEAARSGPVAELFRHVNGSMSRFDLWKETAAWWSLEGEAFWWFGPEYSGGIPRELNVLDPRRMRLEQGTGRKRWFYQGERELVPILADELVHFRDWNPWNPERGINPLLALALEIDQDYFANKANTQLLKHNAIPQGILKTDQTIRPEEADAIERRWEQKYGASRADRKIAVLGKGTEFKPLSFTPEVVKLFELKKWNLYTILSKYGIPPRVAGVSDEGTALSGKDTKEPPFRGRTRRNNTPLSGSTRSCRSSSSSSRSRRPSSSRGSACGSGACSTFPTFRNCKRARTNRASGTSPK